MPRHIGFENLRENFLGRLHQTFGPARLLRFEPVHVHWQLRGAFDLGEIQELPAFQLRAVRKIRVFRERVVLPASSVVNHFAPPHARRAVEIEKRAPSRTCAMLHDKVAIQKNRLDIRQKRIVAVEIRPPRLHHPDFFAVAGIQEIRNRAPQKIRLGNKVGIKNRHEFTLRRLQTVFQCARFVAFAVRTMNVSDRHALRGVTLYAGAGNILCFIGGIVKHLDVEQLSRIIEPRDGFCEPLNHVAFIEDWQLHRDARPVCDRRR